MSPIETAPFHVVYFDGNSEINLGTVTVHPFRSFNRLLSLLSRKIGVSPRHLSVFLAQQGTNWKIPLTRKFNLAAVSRNGAAYYLYVRRSKKTKSHTKSKRLQQEKVPLLRRDGADEDNGEPFWLEPMLATAEETMLQIMMRSLLMETEVDVVESLKRETSGDGDGVGAVCEECLEAKMNGIDAGFHLCVHDEVIVGFRSTAGPVSPPARKSGEEDH